MPRISEIYGGHSVMPDGGSPVQDEAFLGWLEPFATENNARILDRYRPDQLPNRDPLPLFRIVNHLLTIFHDSTRIDWSDLNHRHRIRSLAIVFAARPGTITTEAQRYVDRLMDEIGD